MIGSCDLFDKESILDENAEGSNLATFEKNDILYSQVATGDEYTFDVLVKVKGPNVSDMTGDVPVTFVVDPSSTAVEGVHYRLETSEVTLKADNNYLGKFSVTMITDGIVAPLAEDPQLVIKAVTSGSTEDVVADGVNCEINLVYGCLSHMEGAYTTERFVEWTTGSPYVDVFSDNLTKVGVETYENDEIYWSWSVPGYQFSNKCGDLTIAQSYHGYWLQGTGQYDEVTGVVSVDYGLYALKGDADWLVHMKFVHTPVK